jgi:hypothetical protein
MTKREHIENEKNKRKRKKSRSGESRISPISLRRRRPRTDSEDIDDQTISMVKKRASELEGIAPIPAWDALSHSEREKNHVK